MGPTIALACLQVVPTTVIFFVVITARMGTQTLGGIMLGFVVNVCCVQPVNSFMAVLIGLVLSTDGKVPEAKNDSSRGRRRRWGQRVLGWGVAAGLLALDIGLLYYNVNFPGENYLQYTLLYYCCGALGCVCGVGFWDIAQPQAAWQRWRQQGRTDTLPLVEGGGHELEAVL